MKKKPLLEVYCMKNTSHYEAIYELQGQFNKAIGIELVTGHDVSNAVHMDEEAQRMIAVIKASQALKDYVWKHMQNIHKYQYYIVMPSEDPYPYDDEENKFQTSMVHVAGREAWYTGVEFLQLRTNGMSVESLEVFKKAGLMNDHLMRFAYFKCDLRLRVNNFDDFVVDDNLIHYLYENTQDKNIIADEMRIESLRKFYETATCKEIKKNLEMQLWNMC